MGGPLAFVRDGLRAWLGIPDQIDAASTDEPGDGGEETDAENARAIAELAYRRYSEEIAQSKDIEARASPVLSLLSAALVFGVNALSNGGGCLVGWERWAFYAALICGMSLLLFAEFNLFLVLTTQGFVSFRLRDWASMEYTRRPASELRTTYEEIAGSYRLYTEQNAPLVAAKLRRYNRALTMVFFGIVIIVIDFVWAGCGVPRLW